MFTKITNLQLTYLSSTMALDFHIRMQSSLVPRKWKWALRKCRRNQETEVTQLICRNESLTYFPIASKGAIEGASTREQHFINCNVT